MRNTSSEYAYQLKTLLLLAHSIWQLHCGSEFSNIDSLSLPKACASMPCGITVLWLSSAILVTHTAAAERSDHAYAFCAMHDGYKQTKPYIS